MGQIIASGNLKGGTGKTTIAVNLSCALAARGLQVTLLDLDPQGSASAWGRSGRLPVRIETVPPISLQTAGRWLARAAELATTAEILVIDLPSVMVPPLASVTMIADLILVPITPSALDVAPTEQVLRMIRISCESRRDGKPLAMLVPNKVERGAEYHEATRTALQDLPGRWAPIIRQHLDHVDAFAHGSWIGQFAPDSAATRDILALANAVATTLGHPSSRRSVIGDATDPADEAQVTA
jgi:chromosome partitioning protein